MNVDNKSSIIAISLVLSSVSLYQTSFNNDNYNEKEVHDSYVAKEVYNNLNKKEVHDSYVAKEVYNNLNKKEVHDSYIAKEVYNNLNKNQNWTVKCNTSGINCYFYSEKGPYEIIKTSISMLFGDYIEIHKRDSSNRFKVNPDNYMDNKIYDKLMRLVKKNKLKQLQGN